MEQVQLSTSAWISFSLAGLGIIISMLVMGWQMFMSPFPVTRKSRFRTAIIMGMMLPAVGFLVLTMMNIWVDAIPWTDELVALLLCTYIPFAMITSWSIFVQLSQLGEQ